LLLIFYPEIPFREIRELFRAGSEFFLNSFCTLALSVELRYRGAEENYLQAMYDARD